MLHWTKKPKPWDKETCYRRYIEGDRISFEKLAKLAEVPYRTLAHWTREDKIAGKCWPDNRAAFQENLSIKTTEKTIEKASDLMSSQHAKILAEHCEAARQYRALAQATAKIQTFLVNGKIAKYQEATGSDKFLSAQAASTELMLIAKDMSLWMGVLDRAIGREREALDLAQHTVNTALKTVTTAGFEVTNVSEQAMRSYLEAEGYQVTPPVAKETPP
ncbi:MAG: hypothetical protein ACRC62_32645 [Microcoleus sp.]